VATIRDIAKQTGYSISTISRVLKGDTDFAVSEETKKAIIQCANVMEYVYKPRSTKNAEKKDLKQYRVGIIPIGMEELERGELQDPYYLYIRNGVESRLDKLNMNNAGIINMNTYEDYQKLSGLDSVIIIGKRKIDVENPYFKKLKQVIFVDYEMENYDSVVSDFVNAVVRAIDYMQECGCKTIGYIGSWDYVNDFKNKVMLRRKDSRQRAFETYAKSKKIDYQNHLYIGEKFTRNEGYILAYKAIRTGSLPDGFLIGSDPMAMGAYRAFFEAGRQVGHDVKIVSIDDIIDANFMTPPLTSVHIHAVEMGEIAVDCLRERIEGREVPVKVVLPVYITKRESCK
jgi:Transcriptional regulators